MEMVFRIWTVVGAEMGPGLREYVDQKKKTDTGRYHGMGVAVLAEKDKGMDGCMGQHRDQILSMWLEKPLKGESQCCCVAL